MKCHFLPYWSDNPYQQLLATGLLNEGVSVVKSSKLEQLARAAPAGDIVHLHWLPLINLPPRRLLNSMLFTRRLSRLHRQGVPIVWTAHNLVPHESFMPTLDLWLTKSVGRLADRIICHSNAARDELISHLEITNQDKVRIIPHGHYIGSYANSVSPADCRKQLALADDDIVFLFLGAIRAYKGVLELIGAFRRLSDPKARLVIAGKPYTAELDAQVRTQMGGDPRIIYRPGFISDDDMQIYLNAADAVVFPYQKSLTSGALILAMSYGRACVAPRLPGMVDCMTEEGGFLYDPEHGDGLFQILSVATKQRERLALMGERNLARARSWDWQSIARATAACYDEARTAAGRRSGAIAAAHGPSRRPIAEEKL
jgi:beta-1,4-mannosyltransferase